MQPENIRKKLFDKYMLPYHDFYAEDFFSKHLFGVHLDRNKGDSGIGISTVGLNPHQIVIAQEGAQ
jgi:hypothetical protein